MSLASSARRASPTDPQAPDYSRVGPSMRTGTDPFA